MKGLEVNHGEEFTLLQLSSANGPVYRSVKRVPLRNARPEEIPLIDVSHIFSDSLKDRQAVAAQIHTAATTIGFFYMINHGIPTALIEAASKSSLEFFHQPAEKKEPVNTDRIGGFNGWKPPSTQRINESESVDVRETFSVKYNPCYDPAFKGFDAIPADIQRHLPAEGADSWWENTSNLPNFKDDIQNYWRALLLLARNLLHSFALGLSLPEDYFDPKTSHPDAALAVNYYPSLSSEQSAQSAGIQENVSIGSHTDFQFFTILWQDTAGGLQVLNTEGEWINAMPIPGSLVVNIGDYLQRITNDRYVSTVHRAINLSGRQRLSMAFFFGFNLNETCGVLPTCVDDEHPAKYEPISCEEWIRRRALNMFIRN